MGDAARAEARRRKILENSQRRLERITGREEKPIIFNDTLSNAEDLTESKDIVDDASIFISHLTESLGDLPSPFVEYVSEDNINEPLLQLPEQKNNIGSLAKIFDSKIDVLLLALFVNVSHLVTGVSASDYFFLPLIILKITEYFLVQEQSSNSMLKTVLTLSGISSHKLHYLFKVSNFLQKMLKDSCLYVFIYVLLHLLFGSI